MKKGFCEQEYQAIFDKLKQAGQTIDYEWFQAYGDPNLRNGLLVVGRAVNDWRKFNINNDRFEDLYQPEPAPLNADGDIEEFFQQNTTYNFNRSAFWRSVKKTTQNLFACGDRDWGKHLVYSDLYKVALPKSNPNKSLMKLQLPECIEILRQEIKYWQPSHILFLTGWEWVDPFLVDFESRDGIICHGRSSNNLLEDCGQFPNGCRLAVIPHPAGKKEKLLVGSAIAFFHDFHQLQQKVAQVAGASTGEWKYDCPQSEIMFQLSPGWHQKAVPLVIQSDLNKFCFRIGIWTQDEFFAPLKDILEQKLARPMLSNSAWRGGYTEIKFCDANAQLVNLTREICALFKK